MIEHNVDVMLDADNLIDLGPEGGAAGGRIVAHGSPDEILRRMPRSSRTAAALRDALRDEAARHAPPREP